MEDWILIFEQFFYWSWSDYEVKKWTHALLEIA